MITLIEVSFLFVPPASQAEDGIRDKKIAEQLGLIAIIDKQNQPETRHVYDLGDGWEAEGIAYPILCTSLYRSADNKQVEIKEKDFWEADALILRKQGKHSYCLIHDAGLIPNQIVLDEKLERIAFPTRVDTATFEIRLVSLKTYECRLVDITPIAEMMFQYKNWAGWLDGGPLAPHHLFFLRKEGNKAVGYTTCHALHIKFAVDLGQEWPEEGKDCKLEIIGFKVSDKVPTIHDFKEEL